MADLRHRPAVHAMRGCPPAIPYNPRYASVDVRRPTSARTSKAAAHKQAD
jgi:hypothetical protein